MLMGGAGSGNDQHRIHEWQVPDRNAPDTYRKGWYDELVQSGERFLDEQRAMKFIKEDIALLMGWDQPHDLKSNTFQTAIRSFVETISDLREIVTWGAKAEQFKKNVEAYNAALKYIYWDSSFVWNQRRSLQWAMTGRAYTWLKYSADHCGWGKERNVFDALGPREVLIEQLPADNDIQGSYAVTVLKPMPIFEAHARFPKFQEYLQPIARFDWKKYGTLGLARAIDTMARNRFSEDPNWTEKYCMIRYHWIRDMSINEGKNIVKMGSKGSSWEYDVHPVGSLIVTENGFNGFPESRDATEKDAALYPQLRLAMTSPTCPIPMYDNTAFDNHGEIPVVSHDVNDWVWSATGHSLIRQVAGLVQAQRARLSEINQVLAIRKNPPLGTDLTAGVPRTQLDNMNLLKAQGIRIGMKGSPEKAIASILPESIQVNEQDWKGQEALEGGIKGTLGTSDIASMRDLKMNISTESFDKMMENMGPIAKGISLNQWRTNAKLANMLKYNISQYITVDKLMDMIGPDSLNIEAFDGDPHTLIPQKLPDEPKNDKPSKYSKRQRAKWLVDKMEIISTPAQLNNGTQMQERMVNMMFLQKGAQISSEEIYGKLGVVDYGTLHDKFWEEKQADAIKQVEIQAAVQTKMRELGVEPPSQDHPGQGQGGGRPATAAVAPHAEMKGSHDGNVRVVNSQSK